LNFNFYSVPTFETWDWTNPLSVGIGGSETSHVEMAERLARRGHTVVSWAPTGRPGIERANGVDWIDFTKENTPFAEIGGRINVIYRAPELADQLDGKSPAWLICQDVNYPQMNPERAAKFTRIVALCEEHALHLKALYPYAADKVFISSNGIRSELIRERIRAQQAGQIPARNPKRLMYASSPDRGLWFLLHIFSKVRELVPDAELHVFYGFNNMSKVPGWMAKRQPLNARLLEQRNQALVDALNAPGVVHHGRIGQRDIVDEWLQSGIWCHPSDFAETSCITCMDAQACGAVPITTPKWAIRENVQFGVMLEGNPETSGLVRSRYVMELKGLLEDVDRQETIRAEMQGWALETFAWENFVTQWEDWALADLNTDIDTTQAQRAAGPMALAHRKIDCKRAIGTVAYMGGIQATLEPFTWAWGDLREFTREALCAPDEYVYADRARHSLHDKARNELCQRMVGDWLFMLDCDLTFEPDICAHLVTLMYKYDLDVVSGLYPYKNNPTLPILSHWNAERLKYEPIIAWDESRDLFEFGAGGGGILLIRRRVFETIHARLRQEPFARIWDEEIQTTAGEDFSFFERLRVLGIKAHCAWRTQAGHLDFQSKMLDMKNLNRERFGYLERETHGFAVGNQLAQKGA
jgi:glycosyltransferase involved in cell wall biosynthesis